ncbi:hypothetical protein H0H93_002186, partial [Arthromyces matolae]
MDPGDPVSSSSLSSSAHPTVAIHAAGSSPKSFLRRRSSAASNRTTHVQSPSSYTNDHLEAREHQRTMDVDMARHLSLARRNTLLGSSENVLVFPQQDQDHFLESPIQSNTEDEALGQMPNSSRIDLTTMRLSAMHEASLLARAPHERTQVSSRPLPRSEPLHVLPTYITDSLPSEFNFNPMEDFCALEGASLGIRPAPTVALDSLQPIGSPLSEPESPPILSDCEDPPQSRGGSPHQSKFYRPRRKDIKGKMAVFEKSESIHAGNGASSSSSRVDIPSLRSQSQSISDIKAQTHTHSDPPPATILNEVPNRDRPHRFSFHSNSLPSTIYARCLSELPPD